MIDTEALRKKVIDLAIQGKLTEQLPEDGDAESLYSHIQDEKKKLIGEGKIKKRKTLPKITGEQKPFDIPDNWKWIHVTDVWTIINGDRGNNYPAKSTLTHEGIPFISAVNLDGKTVVSDDRLMRLSDSQYEMLGSGKLKKGDVVVCIRGSLGKHGKYPFDKGAIASSLIIARNNIENDIINDYLMVYLGSSLFETEIEKYNGGAAQPNLAAGNFEKFRVTFPPLEEQERILEVLGKIFDILDEIDVLQNKYKNDVTVLKNKIIDAGIRGKLTEQLPADGNAEDLFEQIQEEKEKLVKEGKIKKMSKTSDIDLEEILFEKPDNWKWTRITDVIDVRDGTHDSPKYHEQGIPLITSKNISSGELSFDDVKLISNEDAKKINERSYVDEGDILFAMIGSIGNPVIVRKDREFCIKNVALFKNYASKFLSTEYVYWFLMHEQYVLRKTANGGLQPFVSLKILRNHLMPLPPLSEQKRIAKKIDSLLGVISN